MSETTLSCGCDVGLGRSGLCSKAYKDSAWISQCRIHRAASELLAALKELSLREPLCDDGDPLLTAARNAAKAAIAKAEGRA